jgi:hypothetical protein
VTTYIAQTADGEQQKAFDNRTDAMREVRYIAAQNGVGELLKSGKSGRLYIDTRVTQTSFKVPK